MVKGGYRWLIKGTKVQEFPYFGYKRLIKVIKVGLSEQFKSLCPCQKKTLIVIQSESFSVIFAFGELNWLSPAKFASQAKLPAGSWGEYNFALCVSTEFRCFEETISLPPNGRQFN